MKIFKVGHSRINKCCTSAVDSSADRSNFLIGIGDNLKYFIEFGKDSCKSVLFCQESSAYDEKWEGARLGYSEAVSFLGVDDVAPLPSLGTE